jgi:hypothetical protein
MKLKPQARLLDAGLSTLQSGDRNADNYGRKFRMVKRNGQSPGGILVSEGRSTYVSAGTTPIGVPTL